MGCYGVCGYLLVIELICGGLLCGVLGLVSSELVVGVGFLEFVCVVFILFTFILLF